MKSKEFLSIQKFFHQYLPISIILLAIVYLLALTNDELHDMLHEPSIMVLALVFALITIVIYWQPKASK